MNTPQIFTHAVFGNLPVIVVHGVEWFGATEAAKALGFSNPHKAIDHHVEKEDCTVHTVLTDGGQQNKKFINESGIYSLIFGSARQGNNPEIREKAKQFKRWVTSEILPSIRKHGAYLTPEKIEEVLLNPDTIIHLATKLKQEQEEKAALLQKIEADKPKVIFAESVSASKSSILVGELAKILRQNGIDIGQNRLFKWLRENGYLIKRRGTDYNMPTQKAMELGLFEIKETSITHSNGEISVCKTPKVTGKGQIYFINKFKGLATLEDKRYEKENSPSQRHGNGR